MLHDVPGIIIETDTRSHLIPPMFKTASRSAVVAAAGPPGVVIDGQRIERRPAVFMAPSRDLTQEFTDRRFEIRESSLVAEITIREEIGFEARSVIDSLLP